MYESQEDVDSRATLEEEYAEELKRLFWKGGRVSWLMLVRWIMAHSTDFDSYREVRFVREGEKE